MAASTAYPPFHLLSCPSEVISELLRLLDIVYRIRCEMVCKPLGKLLWKTIDRLDKRVLTGSHQDIFKSLAAKPRLTHLRSIETDASKSNGSLFYTMSIIEKQKKLQKIQLNDGFDPWALSSLIRLGRFGQSLTTFRVHLGETVYVDQQIEILCTHTPNLKWLGYCGTHVNITNPATYDLIAKSLPRLEVLGLPFTGWSNFGQLKPLEHLRCIISASKMIDRISIALGGSLLIEQMNKHLPSLHLNLWVVDDYSAGNAITQFAWKSTTSYKPLNTPAGRVPKAKTNDKSLTLEDYIAFGFDINARHPFTNAPLLCNASAAVWSLLTKAGIDQTMRDNTGACALHKMSVSELKKLLAEPALASHINWGVRDYAGRTVFITLINKDPKPAVMNSLFGAPWESACAKAESRRSLLYEPGEPVMMTQLLSMIDQENVAKALVHLVKRSSKSKKKAFYDINSTIAPHNRSALHFAALRGRPEAFVALLKLGADVTMRDAAGYTAGDYALYARRVEIIKPYNEAYAAATANLANAPPAFHPNAVKRVAKKLTDIHRINQRAKRPKLPGLATGVLKKFLDAKVDIFSFLDNTGATLLMAMCRGNNPAPPALVASTITALSEAFEPKQLKRLLNAHDKNGDTVLHFVSRQCLTNGSWNAVLSALAPFADAEIKNNAGFTAGQEFASAGSPLSWLLSNGKTKVETSGSLTYKWSDDDTTATLNKEERMHLNFDEMGVEFYSLPKPWYPSRILAKKKPIEKKVQKKAESSSDSSYSSTSSSEPSSSSYDSDSDDDESSEEETSDSGS